MNEIKICCFSSNCIKGKYIYTRETVEFTQAIFYEQK